MPVVRCGRMSMLHLSSAPACMALMQVISVDPPATVELQIVETDPGVKGNTAQGPRLWS